MDLAAVGLWHCASDQDVFGELHNCFEAGWIQSGQGRTSGHLMAAAALVAYQGLRVPRLQILRTQRAHDPAANSARLERTLRRTVTKSPLQWRCGVVAHRLCAPR